MKRILYIFCVLLSLTNLSFFSIGLAEFTLFHAAVPIVILINTIQSIQKNRLSAKVPWTLILLALYLIGINLSFWNVAKGTSLIYSLVTLLELLLLIKITRNLEVWEIKRIIKGIIFLYSLNVSITYFLISIGQIPSGFLSNIFQVYSDINQIRPGGFSSEPSYTAIILVFTLYTLFKCDNFTFSLKESAWYLIAIIAIILSGSSYGYLMLFILLSYFIIRIKLLTGILRILVNRPGSAQVAIIFFVLIFSILLFKNWQAIESNRSTQRLVKIFSILSTSNGDLYTAAYRITTTDGSASMRIDPTLQLLNYYKTADLKNILFGNGAGQSVPFFSNIYGSITNLGFIPAFAFNYGVIGITLFFAYFLSLFPKEKFILLILFSLFLFNADFNTQIFLYILFTIMLCKKIERAIESEAFT